MLSFRGQLRPSQLEVAEIAREHLAQGKRRLHVVAPPGSGKTVIGLYIWAELVRQPALVLSPNSAIQAQWAARTSLFQRHDVEDLQSLVSTSAKLPGLLTSLTYQAVTMPGRATEHFQQRAIDLWMARLLEKGQAKDVVEAEVWIEGLRQHNQDFFNERLAHYRKKIREEDAAGGLAMTLLHDRCIDALVRLREFGVGLLILDECHHLMGHWGSVLAEASEYLGDPIVLGLTATPPDREGRKPEAVERYDRFFGEVDYEVPVPAVVKDGFLAPYQDLAFFVRPNEKELDFVASADTQFDSLIEALCQPRETTESLEAIRPRESLIEWLVRVLRDRQLPIGQAKDWRRFYARDPNFATAAVSFLQSRGVEVPAGVPPLLALENDDQPMDDETLLVTVIDRYTRHYLRRSPHQADHALARNAVDRLRMLGIQITDTGVRACASPVSRVIAYTRSKTEAVVSILKQEMETLGAKTRAVVIADFEKSSAISADIAHLLDEEAGGAVAAFRTLLDHPATNQLDPVLLTGSTVLADADLVVRLLDESNRWMAERSVSVDLSSTPQGTFHEITGRGRDWCPRVYVEMITELFQQGFTRCLVGTRGLLGEGWDANKVNVLIDLSTVTTSMTVNQLRGRSIRLDPDEPRKVANNWDVVCIAPEFTKGLDDYHRFIRKHKTIYGICDDGAIEKGVGHVDPAFTDMKPELVDNRIDELNSNMLHRSARRREAYDLWRVGKPYSNEPIQAVEIASRRSNFTHGYPPFPKSKKFWTLDSLVQEISCSVLGGLCETGLVSSSGSVRISNRSGGYVRVYLEHGTADEANLFAVAMRETLSPLADPRYVIQRFVDVPKDSFVRRLLPSMFSRLFERRVRTRVMLHAVPSMMASKRDTVEIYRQYWNAHVSPGEAVYVKNEKGYRHIVSAIEQDQTPTTIVHQKELFL
ncbi:Type III restriction enzyme, res subunit [Planctomycetes bacterium CA13]|uniref:Type III restriction enzyme, res subunit n=1 Tax=Novipirellula herctigrandis TaxID=2527986 RepID=A0A5C5Z4G2_9BACT|nr:Type III restriction enzyme, res subunit [Planctomycetes bacterium CA13]